jgi:hypothetical protein
MPELEFGEVELEVELELLVLEVPTLLPVWSLELPVPPSFLLHPAKATTAQKMRIDFFINDFLVLFVGCRSFASNVDITLGSRRSSTTR